MIGNFRLFVYSMSQIPPEIQSPNQLKSKPTAGQLLSNLKIYNITRGDTRANYRNRFVGGVKQPHPPPPSPPNCDNG